MQPHRRIGWVLIIVAAAMVVTMSHHPSQASARQLANSVHAGMILWLLLSLWCLTQFFRSQHLLNATISAGFMAFAMAIFGHAAAATINGFAVPALAARGIARGADVYAFAWELNQALTRIAFVTGGAAFLIWGAYLYRAPGRGFRLLAVTGAVAGAMQVLIVVAGLVPLDTHGALLAYAVFAAWLAHVGFVMASGHHEERPGSDHTRGIVSASS